MIPLIVAGGLAAMASMTLFAVFLWTGGFDVVALRPALAWDAALCLIFYLQHSGMVRKRFRARLGRYHGAVYALASAAALALLCLGWQRSSLVALQLTGAAAGAVRAVFLLSWVGVAWCIRSLGAFDPFGIRITTELAIRGPYRWVRHPLYFFSIVSLWASPAQSADRILLEVLTTAWIAIGAMLEERDLVAQFGKAYQDYQRAVPMLIPRWRRLQRAAIPVVVVGLSLTAPVWGQKPVPIRIRVASGAPAWTMRGGIGASWHAIEKPILGHAKPPIGTHPLGGSAWGANPPAEDREAWNSLYRHASWLGLDWCRVELEQRMYEPRRGQFDWDNPEMRILYRILDWAEQNGVDVFLQQMWANVEWNAYPELRGDPSRWLISAPASLDDFAQGMATLVEHLVRARKYRSIRWVSIANEPGFNWSWWQAGDGRPLPITPGLKALRAELDRRGIEVPLAAPDWTGLPELDPAKLDFDPLVGAYDLHTYGDAFDGFGCGVPLSATEKRLQRWAQWTRARGKPFFLSELGTSIYGNRGRDPGPGLYESALKDAALVVRGIRAGVDGFNRWSFLNRGDLDGQWQMVDTWDFDENRLRAQFQPHPNAYYLYGLLSRLTARHSGVLATAVEGNPAENERNVVAAALRSPKGNLSLLVVNETYWEADVAVEFTGSSASLFRYAVTPADRDKPQVAIRPGGRFQAAGFRDRIPGLSVVVYSTFELGADDAGIFADE